MGVERRSSLSSYDIPDGQRCEAPNCDNPAKVIAPNGYVCETCADDDDVGTA
jgi:hypothetical protein